MSRKIQTIPEPYENLPSLRASTLAIKEVVEELTGQRGRQEDQAVRFGDMPPLPAVGDSVWQAFAYVNSWVDYSAPFSPSGYRKLANGMVILKGMCAGGSAATICTLPPGYRPGIQLLTVAYTSPANACRIDITTAGVITHSGGNNAWISFNNIAFFAEN